jgi:peptidoglycan/LPS O-acetylase OafA/YrhL
MTPGLSLYLDLWRVLAALQVALFHLGKLDASGLGVGIFNGWGHESVVVFFVLSGFVVSHAANTIDLTFARYASSRISRLYSVVIPCLLLTVMFDSTGQFLSPELYDNINISERSTAPFARGLFALLMISESWVSLKFFSNEGLWSLHYEFWYYAIFGFYFYFSGKQRVVLVVVAAIISGPRILLLLPVWLLGVAAYSWPLKLTRRRGFAWAALLQLILVVGVYYQHSLPMWAFQYVRVVCDAMGVKLGWSTTVVSDTILALSFALHLSAVKQFDRQFFVALRGIGSWIRWGAARSFTLYLMHQPLMLLMAALMLRVTDGPWRTIVIVVGTIGIPLLVAPMIESQRHTLRPWVERLQHRLWPVAHELRPQATP